MRKPDLSEKKILERDNKGLTQTWNVFLMVVFKLESRWNFIHDVAGQVKAL